MIAMYEVRKIPIEVRIATNDACLDGFRVLVCCLTYIHVVQTFAVVDPLHALDSVTCSNPPTSQTC